MKGFFGPAHGDAREDRLSYTPVLVTVFLNILVQLALPDVFVFFDAALAAPK